MQQPLEEFFLKNTLEINEGKKHDHSLNNINIYIKNNYNYILEIDETFHNKIIANFHDMKLEFKPRKLMVGIGSKKDISENHVLIAVKKAMENLGISFYRIDCLATVSIKKMKLEF